MRLAVTVCLAWCASLAGAPAPALSGQESGADAFDGMLSEGDHVRLAAPGIAIDAALVTRVTVDSLHVAWEGQEWLLSADAIERLEVRRGQAVRWAWRGALAGAFLGALSDYFISALCVGCGTSYKVAALRGAVAGGGFGAALGWRAVRWDGVVQ